MVGELQERKRWGKIQRREEIGDERVRVGERVDWKRNKGWEGGEEG